MAEFSSANPTSGPCSDAGELLRIETEDRQPRTWAGRGRAADYWPGRAAVPAIASTIAIVHLALLMGYLLWPLAAGAGAAANLEPGIDAHGWMSGVLLLTGSAVALLAVTFLGNSSDAVARGGHRGASACPRQINVVAPRHDTLAADSAIADAPGQAPAATLKSNPASPASPDWAEIMARTNHELRTPLNAVIGFSDIMQRELLGPIGHERYKDYIGDIRDSGFALMRALDDTLAVTNLLGNADALEARSAVLAPALRDAWRRLSHEAAEKGVKLQPQLPEVLTRGDITVRGDEQGLSQALVNLLSEALRVCREGEPLQLALAIEDENLRLSVSCAAAQPGPDGEVARTKSGHACQDEPRSQGLSLALARLLFELQGASLSAPHHMAGRWCISADLELAAVR